MINDALFVFLRVSKAERVQ